MNYITRGLLNAGDSYSLISPYWGDAIALKWVARILRAKRITDKVIPVIKGTESPGTAVGNYLANKAISKSAGALFNNALNRATNTSHLVFAKRSWFDKRGNINVVFVYHDAYKASKHIDIHFSNGTSFIIRVSGKPVEKLIKYNNNGELTQSSKDALLEHVHQEVKGNSRVPQNLDHNTSEAKISWLKDQGPKEGYGSGQTRQVILETKAVIFKLAEGKGRTTELWIPDIDPNNNMYIHNLYSGDSNRAPIVIWGMMKSKAPKQFEDRLHLKLYQLNEIDKFRNDSDAASITTKYDGASCYVVTTKEGTTVWSPRVSKTTGERIEYTPKLWELAESTDKNRPVGMGELLFRKTYLHGLIKGGYLPAAEIGGILNKNAVRPDNIIPEIRMYRVDKWNGKKVSDLPFFDNRKLQTKMTSNSEILDVVEFSPLKHIKGNEGLVAVPSGKSINEGYKIKWLQDPDDWVITDVDLKLSDKGNPSGVVWFKSLESGKEFKLGPGQLGNLDSNMDIINNPDKYIGRVAKVVSREGHEGRAAKLIDWHIDK